MRNIVWDFDGTLANSYPGMVIAVQESLKNNFKIELSKDTIYTDIKKTSIRHYVTQLMANRERDDLAIKKDVDIFYHDYKLIEQRNQDKIQLLHHAKKALDYLKQQGMRQFIVTHRDKSIKTLVDRLGIKDYFTEVVSVEDGHIRKPDANMLNYLIDKYQIDGDLWVIGDREIDIDFGKSVAAKTILLSENAADFGQDETITDLQQLIDVFK